MQLPQPSFNRDRGQGLKDEADYLGHVAIYPSRHIVLRERWKLVSEEKLVVTQRLQRRVRQRQ